MATRVKELLKQKGYEVWTVEVDSTVKDALMLMAEKQIGAVPVVEGGAIRGIFSERDFVTYVAATGQPSLETPVRKLMVHPVYYVDPEQTCEDCMALMTAKFLRHLPVVENEHLIGIVTIGDIIRRIISDKNMKIQDLEHFAWSNVI
jgi:CBS domain-containing protein